jgi:hypothetical protein
MLSCDYNGWSDAPEDEREEQDALSTSFARTPVFRCDRGARRHASDAGSLVTLGVAHRATRSPSAPHAGVRDGLFLYLGGAKLLGLPAAVRLFTTSAGANGSGTSPGSSS